MSNHLSFAKLSIQNRLILFTCILLLCVILVFGYTSYLALQNTALTAGKERLASLTEQISSMFQQMENIITEQARKTAEDSAIESFLQSKGTGFIAQAQQVLTHMQRFDLQVTFIAIHN